MFKEREKFNKFLSIATPIICGANILIVLIKFIGVFATTSPYEQRMFAFTTMYNPPGFLYYIHYMLSGLIFSANIAYGVLSFVALSMIKDDQKHRVLALTFAIISLVMLIALTSLGFGMDVEKVTYWVVPLWFIVLAYHIAFSFIFFFRYLRIRKQGK